MSKDTQSIDLERSKLSVLLTACEFGYKGCERGDSLDLTFKRMKEVLMSKKEDK